MKILYIHQDGQYTGSAISLSYLIYHLDRTRFEPWVLMAEEGPARKLFEAAGAKVEVKMFRRFWTAPGPRWFALASWRQWLFFLPQTALKKWVKLRAPSIIHLNDKATAPAGWALKSLGIPIVQQLRSTYFSTTSAFNKWLSINMIRYFSDAYIAISEDEIEGFEPQRPDVIFNSIDLYKAVHARNSRSEIRAKYSIQEQDFLVGYLSVVSPLRGIWNFLDMAKHIQSLEKTALSSNFVDKFKYMVVGALPQEDFQKNQLTARIEKTGMTDRLIFTDFRQDSLGYLAAFDLLVVCNEHGVLGRPPLEALAVGTPVVAFCGHSGKSRVLKDGISAKLVKRGDIASLAEAVVYLAQSPVTYAQLCENALSYAQENFSPEKNARKVMAVYERLLKSHA